MPVIHAAAALTPEGWRVDARLTIDGATIISMETGAAPQPGDERCAILVPALCDLHSHAFQRGMAGLAERRGENADTFWTWRETMYRFALAMSPDDVEAVEYRQSRYASPHLTRDKINHRDPGREESPAHRKRHGSLRRRPSRILRQSSDTAL